MTDEIITKFKKNALEEVRATLDEVRGRQVIDFRVWIGPDEGKERKPTKKGLSLLASSFPPIFALLYHIFLILSSLKFRTSGGVITI